MLIRIFAALSLLLALQVSAFAGNAAIGDFFGTFEGEGKPWSWARHDGDTLIITTLLLRENGTYDITSYERALKSKDQMELRFTRFKDGDITRRVKADLARK